MKALGWILLLLISMCTIGAVTDDSNSPQQSAEDRQKGFHCLSAWDGSHPDIVREVKARLRDPGSFEHEATKVTPVKDGRHTLFMTYRARNGFGGMNVEEAVGSYDHVTCAGTLVIAGGL